MVYKPKEIPEDINVTSVHPLVNFAYLLGTVVVVSILIYFALGAIAVGLATRISPELEAKIGRHFASSIREETIETDPRQQQYLENLLAELEKETNPSYTPLTIHIQESNVSNAAIFPGGHILITTTLLAEAESENEIAFVLAHELGHHVARDHLKGLGRSLVFLTIASVVGIGSGDINVVGMTGSLTNLHYSRQQESAADVYALSAIVRCYGHGEGSLDFFQRIQSEKRDNRNQLSSYFSTHPLTQSRINSLHRVAAKKGWKMQGKITNLPEKLFESKKEPESN